MDLGLAGRLALVTGASAGIGKAVALALAGEGASVVINARAADRLEATAAEVRAVADRRAAGGRVHAVAADVASAAGVEGLLAEVRRVAGEPAVLVANAGGPPKGLPTSLGDEEWSRAFELTLLSAVRLSRAVLPAMRRAGWGRIVNVTSLSVREPIADLTLSNAMRSGLTAYAKTLSTEVAGDGVTVNNVAPGYTATERLDDVLSDTAARRRLLDEIPVARLAEPAEVAAAVAFLASAPAAYITGQTLLVDGGLVRSQY